jgi:hypothetical protein
VASRSTVALTPDARSSPTTLTLAGALVISGVKLRVTPTGRVGLDFTHAGITAGAADGKSRACG